MDNLSNVNPYHKQAYTIRCFIGFRVVKIKQYSEILQEIIYNVLHKYIFIYDKSTSEM